MSQRLAGTYSDETAVFDRVTRVPASSSSRLRASSDGADRTRALLTGTDPADPAASGRADDRVHGGSVGGQHGRGVLRRLSRLGCAGGSGGELSFTDVDDHNVRRRDGRRDGLGHRAGTGRGPEPRRSPAGRALHGDRASRWAFSSRPAYCWEAGAFSCSWGRRGRRSKWPGRMRESCLPARSHSGCSTPWRASFAEPAIRRGPRLVGIVGAGLILAVSPAFIFGFGPIPAHGDRRGSMGRRGLLRDRHGGTGHSCSSAATARPGLRVIRLCSNRACSGRFFVWAFPARSTRSRST